MKEGDWLETNEGKAVAISKIVVKHENTTVYNFKVADYHSYFVSNLNIWTHNSCDVPWIKAGNSSTKGTGNLNRREALNQAKDLAGIPRSQQPTRQWQVGDDINKKGGNYKNYEYSSNPTHHGRYYEYDTPQGKRVIVDHTNDGRLHVHAGKPKEGANPFDYDFKKERYANIYGPNEDHHIYYNR